MALIGKNNHSSVLDENASLFQEQAEKTEKQKWASLTNQQRFQYFLDYYLLKRLAVITLVIFLGIFLWTFLKPKQERALFLAVIHNLLPLNEKEELEQTLSEILLTDSNKQEIHIDDTFSTGYESDIKLSAFLSAQEIDVIITNEEHFQALAKNGCFADLNELLPAFSIEHEDLLYWAKGYTEESTNTDSGSLSDIQSPDESKKAYGIDISNSEMFKQLWFHDQHAILGIIQNCKQQENAIITLKNMFSNK